MRQLRAGKSDFVAGQSNDFQVDKISADKLGGRPTLLALEGWPEIP